MARLFWIASVLVAAVSSAMAACDEHCSECEDRLELCQCLGWPDPCWIEGIDFGGSAVERTEE
ncbi:hypothetical protein CLAFUW4_08777 [Fulvia fulva]|uniref:Candidate effector 2 n=1 Tax=Passalora fulva TaxID=5499 RepID=A0A023UIL7_PASFU|nr:candidate effector 2 [Fulvia fulva]KAK4614099.1 hypothetical protein CLAFUR4_08783 [Fulvia fulva]KAK4615213.1 hypothetical protein CLAFUR0_08775 [Fulvia fulva]WPV19912.1 hypothetical protein CLAFUW4_08777 [Fulvia fulva]WPV35140.1 hypothetical protein CLAFUW7_08778 [Fulvia fulva]